MSQPANLTLYARVGAVETLLETLYAAVLVQSPDPIAEVRRSAADMRAIARDAHVEVAGVDPALTRALVEAMAGELDHLFARIERRLTLSGIAAGGHA